MPASATSVTLSGAMEGNIAVNPGDTVRAGYAIAMPGAHPAAQVTISSAGAAVQVTCSGGKTQWINIGLPGQTFAIAASDASWQPSADPGAAWQGSTTAPSGLCGGSGGHAPKGATMWANLTSTDTADPVSIRFHYSDNSPGAWSPSASVTPSSSSGAPPPTGSPHPTAPPLAPPPAQPATTGAPAVASASSAALGPRHVPPTTRSPAAAAVTTTQSASPNRSATAGAAPGELQTSITALQRGIDDGSGAVTAPSTVVGLWTAAGVGIVALLARWRWRRRAQRH